MPYSNSQKDRKSTERKQSTNTNTKATNTNTKAAEMLALSKILKAYIVGRHGCVDLESQHWEG